MKVLVLTLLTVLAGLANALEREQDFGLEAESSPAEETTVQVPVTTMKSNVKDDDDDDSTSDELRPTECSNFLCSAMCRRVGCEEALCTRDRRCVCICARHISPRDFFRRVFGSMYTPRIDDFFPNVPRVPDFPTMPRFEDRFRDVSKLLESFGNSDGMSSKVYYTMQHTCEQPEDCSHVCANCTTTKCADNYCQCLSCDNKDAVESRAAGRPEKTCSVVRECEETCKGCAKIGCRYGSCQCSRCEESETTENPSTSTTELSVTEDTKTTLASEEDGETSTVSVDVFRVRPSLQSRNDAILNGRCIPKRCNHACWERQCAKWNCVENRCDCDGCPEDMSVVVRNSDGKSRKPEDSDKYEIIF